MNNNIDKLDNGDFEVSKAALWPEKFENTKTIGEYTVKTAYVRASVGTMSLIGTGNARPVSWGNYFWLSDGPRVVNFWAENLTAANEEFNLNGHVKVRQYTSEKGSYVLIDDPRIPAHWYYNNLCFTGSYAPPIDVIKDMFDYLGDPDNEFEKYTDPESYYLKRGKKYTTNGTWYTISDINPEPPRELKQVWSGKTTTGEAYFYAPYIPNVEDFKK